MRARWNCRHIGDIRADAVARSVLPDCYSAEDAIFNVQRAALLVDGIFRGASFCKYVCPIGQFHFVSSLVSPREVRVRSLAVCQKCGTYDCIRGNDRARGCW